MRTITVFLSLLLVTTAASSAFADDADASAPDEARGPVIRVLAYNIKHGRGMDDKVDLARTAAVINRLEADVVTLQEVDEKCSRSGNVDEAAWLGKATEKAHAFSVFFNYQGGRYGMGMLSSFPMKAPETIRLPDGAEPRTALRAIITEPTTGREIVVVGVHFYATEAERLAQAKKLVVSLKDETRPVVIAGDFNSTREDGVMKYFAETGWANPDKGEDRFTFRSDKPRTEIDFIIFRPANAFEVVAVDVIEEPLASDHRPLVTDLRLLPVPEKVE